MSPSSSKISRLFIFLFIPLCIFLSFNKHSKSKYDNYHGVIWADAAGYYVYLPIWFINGTDASQFPEGITETTGKGFHFDGNNVVTKYPCGVALLQVPFFLTSHFLAPSLHQANNGFSPVYHWGVMIAAVVYGCLGLFFLCLYLEKLFKPNIAFITCIVLLAATNLYYYTIEASGMSHAYSFFTFSALLYFGDKLFKQVTLGRAFIFGLLCGLAILIRPTNLIFIGFILLLNWDGTNGITHKASELLKKPASIALIILSGIVVFIPQLFYWKSTSGSLLHYSYGDEGFSNLFNPQIFKVWFSPNNGLFLYSPLILLSLIGVVGMSIKRNYTGILIGLFFLLISYVFASWWCWWYGCSLGSRSFVEYYAMLAIPLAWLLSQLKTKTQIGLVSTFIIACIWLNFDITYYYDGCFYGGDWDWEAYLELLND